jgi:hypothetical protein
MGIAYTEAQISHLEFIQSIISRMAANSANAKNLCMTIVAALLALYAGQNSKAYLLVSLVPIILFWLTDAMYLRLERGYRSLYNSCRAQSSEQLDFSLSPSFVARETVLYVAFRWSVFWFYLTIFGLVMIVACMG